MPMSPWLQKTVVVIVVITAAYITIHPDYDLLDFVLHSHDRIVHAYAPVAIVINPYRAMAALHFSTEAFRHQDRSGPDSLDLLCVRLC